MQDKKAVKTLELSKRRFLCYSVFLILVTAFATKGVCSAYYWIVTRSLNNRYLKEIAPIPLEWFPREFGKDDSVVVRGNVLAAVELLRSGRFGPHSKPLMIIARLWAEDSGVVGLMAVALAPDVRRTHAVLIYKDSRGRTVQILYKLASSDQPDYMGGFVKKAAVVSGDTLLDQGEPTEDGTIVISDPSLPDFPNMILVPDGDVAVGLRYPDGSYSNFVPLSKEMGGWPR